MCLAIALTAARLGAAVANYTEVTELTKTSDGIVAGARVKDAMTGTSRPLTLCYCSGCICHRDNVIVLWLGLVQFCVMVLKDNLKSELSLISYVYTPVTCEIHFLVKDDTNKDSVVTQ